MSQSRVLPARHHRNLLLDAIVISLFVVFTNAASASEPTFTTNAHADAEAEAEADRALLRSAASTLAGVAVGAVIGFSTDWYWGVGVAGASLVIGPSVGTALGGSWWNATWNAVGRFGLAYLGVSTYALAMYFACERNGPITYATDPAVYWGVAMMTVVPIWAVVDIIRTPAYVRNKAKKTNTEVSVAPLLVRNGYGLAVSVLF